jgi:hypothetical protein
MTATEDFPWIKERAACSAAKLFELLRQQVRQDAEIRQAMSPPMSPGNPESGYSHGFDFTQTGESFTVALNSFQTKERVTFLLRDNVIEVEDSNGMAFLAAVPSLNVQGNCIVLIDKQEYPLWYLRKMALEHLFFEHFSPVTAP